MSRRRARAQIGRSGLPQYSLPRSVNIRCSLTSWLSKKGMTRSFNRVSRGDRRLAIVELGAGHLGVGVDEGLLVDAAHALQIANIERILGAAVARMLALELAMGLLLGLGLFQRSNDPFGLARGTLDPTVSQGSSQNIATSGLIPQPRPPFAVSCDFEF